MNILTILVFLLIALWLHSEISNRLHRLSEYHSQTISLNHRVFDMSVLLQMGLSQSGTALNDGFLQSGAGMGDIPSWTTYGDSLKSVVNEITRLQGELGDPEFASIVEDLSAQSEEFVFLLKEMEGDQLADPEESVARLGDIRATSQRLHGLHTTVHGEHAQIVLSETRTFRQWLFVTFVALSGLSIGLTRYFRRVIRTAQGNFEESQRLMAETSRLAKISGWKVLLPGMEGFWSDEAAHIYDLPTGKYLTAEEGIKYYHPDDLPVIAAAFERAITEHIPYDLELRLTSATGRKKWIRTSGFPVIEKGETVAMQGTIQDITEAKMMEQQLRQSQKMEAIGQLAGGVAHDFNNMLGVILGHAEVIGDHVPADNPARKSAEEIQDVAKRSSSLTRQLLTFARQQHIRPTLLDVNDHIEKTTSMLRRLVGEQVSLSWQPAVDDMPVNLDPVQFDQILVNLVVNARDAISEQGKIEIRAQCRPLSEEEAQQNPDINDEEFVVLTVSDSGSGMSEETLERIFEPFFTTKPAGTSSGLGMSTIFGIVHQNGGFIHVSSRLNEGTEITVGFPLAQVSESPQE